MAEHPVQANIILRPRSGGSILEDTITLHNMKEYLPSEETWVGAQKELSDLGFDVKANRLLSVMVTIVGEKDKFESVFKTTLEERTEEISYGIRATYYVATESLTLPDTLKPYIEAVIIPQPLHIVGPN